MEEGELECGDGAWVCVWVGVDAVVVDDVEGNLAFNLSLALKTVEVVNVGVVLVAMVVVCIVTVGEDSL